MVSGVLLIADAGTTMLWQEPVSAFLGHLHQNELKDALENPPARVLQKHPLKGDAIGRIRMPTLHRSYYVVEGTDRDSLRKGPGHYPDTPLPGEGGTIGIAGHRTTFLAPFRHIDRLRSGEEVALDMTYGTFVYKVEKTKIVDPTDLSVKRRVGYERLIMSACHPLHSASHRIVVFTRLDHREPPRVKRRR
jgi:sortase A